MQSQQFVNLLIMKGKTHGKSIHLKNRIHGRSVAIDQACHTGDHSNGEVENQQDYRL
jgi:hypothetical protein